MFESLDKINIGKLHYENPKKRERQFFISKEVIDDKLKNAEKELVDSLKNHDIAIALTLAGGLKIFAPEKLTPDLADKVWGAFEEFAKRKDLHAYYFMIAKIIFEERFAEWKEKHYEELWQSLLKPIKFSRRKHQWHDYAYRAAQALTVFPEKRAELDLNDGEVLRGITADLERDIRLKSEVNFSNLLWAWHSFKILYPEKPQAISLGKKELAEVVSVWAKEVAKRGKDAMMAIFFQIIAAKKLKITEDKFEIVMSEDESSLKEPLPPMPVFKKFDTK